ncbi:MAG: Voltage-gated ClC-type chloride channel ClcB [Chroococcopsis gigantea SAG 12.99]|jgi:H+/Cl- antiporter ClcA|nr:chloride channel protein [Chlorogloea purpurea SAG 13.99]MDV2998578.1 Voltage-gated ClC-type chloride channel ClcB [Chroococcopsis gigantea SAG 12.99]
MTSTNPILKTQVLPSPDLNTSISSRLTSILNHRQLPPELVLLVSAFLIGSGTGVGIIIFRFLIDVCQTLTFKNFLGIISQWGFQTVALVPVLGGIIVGIMRGLFPKILGQNLSTLISQEGSQNISPWRPLIKMVAAAVSLGTGASLGSESPSVEIGASTGALLGQTFQVAKGRYRLLLGAGAAAGLAAGFHTPIAGVFFALEVVLGTTFTSSALSIILLSAVFADIISRFFSGGNPAFYLPSYSFFSPWEGIFYVGLGVLASLVSLAYTEAIKIAGWAFEGKIPMLKPLGSLPQFIKPALGGLLVGIAALYSPEIMGVGYGTLASILAGRSFPITELLSLLVLKLLATAISSGSGFVGGIFAPAMFLGGCLGALYADVLQQVLPPALAAIAPTPGFAAMVGLAAVLAGSVKAPLTAILMLFELTGNYQVILPVMIAVGICIWVSEGIKSNGSLDSLDLQQMGIGVEKPHDLDVMQKITVSSVMEANYLSLPLALSARSATRKILDSQQHFALVMDDREQIHGIITMGDLKRHLPDLDDANLTLADICTKEVLYTSESQSLAEALKQMNARGLSFLPVIAADHHRRVVGVLSKHGIDLARELAEVESALTPEKEEGLSSSRDGTVAIMGSEKSR